MTKLQTLANTATNVLDEMSRWRAHRDYRAEITSVHNVLVDLVAEPQESAYYRGSGCLDLEEALEDLENTLQELDARTPESAQKIYTRPVHAVIDYLRYTEAYGA
jgi:hypothetical protein